MWEQLTMDHSGLWQVVPRQVFIELYSLVSLDFICVGCLQLQWLSLDNQCIKFPSKQLWLYGAVTSL